MLDLQTLVSRETDPLESAVVTVGVLIHSISLSLVPGLSAAMMALTSTVSVRFKAGIAWLTNRFPDEWGRAAIKRLLLDGQPIYEEPWY